MTPDTRRRRQLRDLVGQCELLLADPGDCATDVVPGGGGCVSDLLPVGVGPFTGEIGGSDADDDLADNRHPIRCGVDADDGGHRAGRFGTECGRTDAAEVGHGQAPVPPRCLTVGRRKLDGTLSLTGHAAPIMAMAFTPDGQRLLSGGWDQNVRVWDPYVATPVATYDWQRGKVHHIAVAPDGMTAAAACDKGIVLWDLDD